MCGPDKSRPLTGSGNANNSMEKQMSRFGTRTKTLSAGLLASAVSMAVLVACGGGSGASGGSNGTAAPGVTAASSSGPISGFGSIIVNRVRIDNSSAQITLDDDDSNGKDADLKLGMMVDVEADTDASGNPGRATSIAARSFVQGPVSAINVAGNQLTVLGVTVTLSARTVFDGVGVSGLASLKVGDGIEVHGIVDASGGVKATRIERKPNATTDVRVTGIVQSMDSESFTVNGVKVKYQSTNLVGLPNGVAAGMLVRVKGTLADSAIVANKVHVYRSGPSLKENRRVEVDGVVTAFTSATSFEINGVTVNVPATAKVQGTVGRGVRVEVKGTATNNVIVASTVEVENENLEPEDAHELHGRVVTLDAAAKSFTMRDGALTVKWDSNTKFDLASFPSGAAGLTTGLKIEIRGKVEGNVLIATTIGIDR
jgi:Domain of unknown function (DUF5666)